MSRFLWIIALLAVGLPSARAGLFRLPANAPYASVTIPDSWQPVLFSQGVEAVSEDQQLHLAVEGGDPRSLDESLDAGTAYLRGKGVEIDSSAVRQRQAKMGEYDVIVTSWNAAYAGNSCKVNVAMISLTADKGLLLLWWSTPAGEEKNKDALSAVVKSIRKI